MSRIKKLIINIAVTVLNLLYLPFKCLKAKNKITYISRQSNNISLDFKLLSGRMKDIDANVEQVILAKKIEKGILKKLNYTFHVFAQMYHIATSKVVVVDTYIIPISVLKHKKDLKVIQIWHALGAIKQFGYQSLDKKEGSSYVVANAMRMHKNYDAITCASSITAEFYSQAFGTDINKIKIVGMPRVDDILGSDCNEEIIAQNSHYFGKSTILYIPTFRKNKKVNIESLIKNIDHSKYNLIIKLHPLDSTEVPQEYSVKGDFSTYDLMKFADYIITDYSATAIEASLLQKPLFLYVYDIDEYNEERGLNVVLTEELKDSTFKDISDIMNVIEKGSYNYWELEQFRNRYVETYNQNNTDNICKLIKKYLEE